MNKKWNDYAQYRKSGIWNVYSFHFFDFLTLFALCE